MDEIYDHFKKYVSKNSSSNNVWEAYQSGFNTALSLQEKQIAELNFKIESLLIDINFLESRIK